jgi:lactate dehydrogenase-like 2-hydroxyacid dehydrogenase
MLRSAPRVAQAIARRSAPLAAAFSSAVGSDLPFKTVGVLGLGLMGAGVAEVTAAGG